MQELGEDITIEDVIKKQKENYPKNCNEALIRKAYEYAKAAHGDQCRKSGEPYMIHPVNVAYILSGLELDDETICAALLHDVVEDTPVTRRRTRKRVWKRNLAVEIIMA